MTLSEARTRIATDLLDDPSNTRWSTTELDRALVPALAHCLEEYASHGGERLLLDSGSVTASSGTYDASALSPLTIKRVALVEDSGYEVPLSPIAPGERQLPDTSTRSIRLYYVQAYELPTTTTHPIVGDGATAANTWDAFDEWICREAALLAEAKERDQPSARLVRLVEQSRASVLSQATTPRAQRFPSRRRWASGLLWSYVPKTITLTRC